VSCVSGVNSDGVTLSICPSVMFASLNASRTVRALVVRVVVLPSATMVMLSVVGGAGVMMGEAHEVMSNETMKQ